MVCTQCNNYLRSGAKFCGQCGTKAKLGKEPSPNKSDSAGYTSEIVFINATGPDSDGDMSVDIKFSITNQSGSSWDHLITRTQLISDSGYVEEITDTHERLVAHGKTEELEVSFYGVKARPFMMSPGKSNVIINLMCCTTLSKTFAEIELPASPFEVSKIEACNLSNSVQLINGGVWRTEPDDDGDVRVEARWLVRNLSADRMPEIRFIAEVSGVGGFEIGDAGGYGELPAFATAVISGSTYAKAKKLKGAKVGLSARVTTATASGSIEYIGMAFSPSDDPAEIDECEVQKADLDGDGAGHSGDALAGPTLFEWKMARGEVNMDDVEEEDVRAALKIVLDLAKKGKFEEAVQALPVVNFEYAFGNLDSDPEFYFGDLEDISFEIDLTNPNHSIAVGVSGGKLIISVAVVFEIPVESNVDAEELNEWLGDNGGYAAGFAAGGWSYSGDEGGHMMLVHQNANVAAKYNIPILSEDVISSIKIGNLPGGTGLDIKRYVRAGLDGDLSSCVVYIEEWDDGRVFCRVRGAYYGYAGGGVYDGGFFLIDFAEDRHQVFDFAEAAEDVNSQLFDALMHECGRVYYEEDEVCKLTEYAIGLIGNGDKVEDGFVYMDESFDGDSLSQVSELWGINLKFYS
jgi:hypothetical protein